MVSITHGKNEKALQRAMFASISEKLAGIREAGKGGQVILVVPAQYTLEAEKAAFEALGGEGFWDLHIMSGDKLRQEIFRETGGPGRTVIDSVGRSMLLRRVAKELKGELSAFGSVCDSPDFIDLAADFIVQLKQCGCGKEEIRQALSGYDPESMTAKKLADMEKIFEGYEKVMEGKFTDTEDELSFAASRISASGLIASSDIVFYGFYSFTKNELRYISALMERARSFGVYLLAGGEEDEDLAIGQRTIKRLTDEAEKAGIPVSVRAEDTPAEKPAEKVTVKCASPYTQAETIAFEILKLLREGKADPGEIAVLTPPGGGLSPVMRRVFTDLGVPFFSDEKRSVLHTAAVECVSSLLDCAADGLRSDHVLRFVRSSVSLDIFGKNAFSGEGERSLEYFANYVKQYHIKNDRFAKPFKYGLSRQGYENMEEVRKAVFGVLSAFTGAFGPAATVREKTEALYIFLRDRIKLPDRLELKAAELSENGLAEASEETWQSWNVLTSLMDQAVELIGDEKTDDAGYRDLLESALSDIQVGLLPQVRDLVTLGTIDRTRLRDIKVLFLAGVNEGLIPSDGKREGLLSDDELAGLEDKGFVFSKNSDVLSMEEAVNIYKAMTSPSELLWASWCLSDANGGELVRSPLIDRLKEEGASERLDIESAGEPLAFIEGSRGTEIKLASELCAFISGQSKGLSPAVKQAFNGLLKKDPGGMRALKDGLFFSNRVDDLGPSGKERVLSPSQLDRFAACPFGYFVMYSLRPDEARPLTVDNADIGNFVHECLMRLCEKLSAPAREKGIAMTAPGSLWMSVSRDEVEEMIRDSLAEVSASVREGIMSAGPEEKYRGERTVEVCLRFAWKMIEQVRKGTIDEMFFETSFGAGQRIAPLIIDTPAGMARIEGKIDRYDVSGPYVKIIDYKTGNTKFDKNAVEEGLKLQLMVYLESVLGSDKSFKPAGIFYYSVREPSDIEKLSDIAADEISEELRKKIDSQYILDGMYVGEREVIDRLDKEAESSNSSTVIKYHRKKDGNFDNYTPAVSSEEFEAFRETFRENLRSRCEELCSGSLDMKRDKNACKFCDYHSICIYDAVFRDNGPGRKKGRGAGY